MTTQKQINDVTKAITLLQSLQKALIEQRFKELEKPESKPITNT